MSAPANGRGDETINSQSPNGAALRRGATSRFRRRGAIRPPSRWHEPTKGCKVVAGIVRLGIPVREETTVPQSLGKVLIHIVYSTKDRRPWLRDEEIRRQLYAYKAAILREKVDSPALIIGGFEDHIHALCLLSRNFAIKKVIEVAKTETTKWLKRQGSQYADFHWQSGYGVFSVSESNGAQVKGYIANQEEHHRRISFQDEYRALCQRHGVPLDERYVWD